MSDPATSPGDSAANAARAPGPSPLAPDGTRTFYSLLVNSLITGVTGTFLWFCVTFWVYLETRSVVATSVIGAAFPLVSAPLGMWFGAFVDHHRKKLAIVVSTALMALSYSAALAVYLLVGSDDVLGLRRPSFWVLILLILLGSVAGQLRGIATATCITLLVPEDRRDRANGLSGSVTGVAFAITSVFSGLTIGQLGMGWAIAIALVLTWVALAHMATIHIPGDVVAPANLDHGTSSKFDFAATREAIRGIPGLMALILFAAFNNLLGGVFMSLMDAYGLEIVSVETWGFLWGLLSTAFIFGGVLVARRGLGSDPLRRIFVGNLINWTMCMFFAIRESIVLLCIGMFVWLLLMPMIEAAEQTVLQRVVPFERQGRVFGFALLVENSASPITSLAIGPIAERVFIPTMTDGRGADWIGGWFGVGPGRGLALIFTLAGVIGFIVTALAWSSRSYRRLHHSFAASAPATAPAG
jgi:MFS transporter, DHA3 family, multidrug efflux protein